MRTKCGLLQVDRHELVTIDLMNPTSESHSPLGSPALFLLECSAWLVLLVLGGPLELDLDVELPLGLQLQPDVMQGLAGLLDKI